jgi:hypothetical protein
VVVGQEIAATFDDFNNRRKRQTLLVNTKRVLARISHRRPDQGRNPLPELRKRK